MSIHKTSNMLTHFMRGGDFVYKAFEKGRLLPFIYESEKLLFHTERLKRENV